MNRILNVVLYAESVKVQNRSRRSETGKYTRSQLHGGCKAYRGTVSRKRSDITLEI